MLEKEVVHLLLSFHHLLQVDRRWCHRFIIVERGFIWLWNVFILITLVIEDGVLVILNDAASAITVILDFCLL